METGRWEDATAQKGKPRIYIQQFLELRLPEKTYRQIAWDLGYEKPFRDETAAAVMETYLEELQDGSQFDTVHIQHDGDTVLLMTVISLPFRQQTFDQLTAEHLVRKALGT